MKEDFLSYIIKNYIDVSKSDYVSFCFNDEDGPSVTVTLTYPLKTVAFDMERLREIEKTKCNCSCNTSDNNPLGVVK